MIASAGAPGSNELQADAFKLLYPDQYYAGFLSRHIRPDGRQLSECRATTVGVDTIGSADSSALVKAGSTTVVAGIKLEQQCAVDDEAAGDGTLALSVEMAAFGSADARPGRPSEAAQCLCMQLERVLAAVLEPGELRMDGVPGGAWRLLLDVYVLDADGSLLDACLLAAAAALLALRLPPATVGEQRQAVRAGDGAMQPGRYIRMAALPLAATYAQIGGHLLADPTAEEEAQASSLVSLITDASGRLAGLHKAGGTAAASAAQLLHCKEAASRRYREHAGILTEALQAAGHDHSPHMMVALY